jgi:excisionase family DNA binding protein
METQERMTEALLLRIPDVARALGLGRSTVYELVAGGEIPVVRIGRAVRVSRDALAQWVRRQELGRE